MKNKKTIFLLLITVFVFCFIGCGSKETNAPSSDSSDITGIYVYNDDLDKPFEETKALEITNVSGDSAYVCIYYYSYYEGELVRSCSYFTGTVTQNGSLSIINFDGYDSFAYPLRGTLYVDGDSKTCEYTVFYTNGDYGNGIEALNNLVWQKAPEQSLSEYGNYQMAREEEYAFLLAEEENYQEEELYYNETVTDYYDPENPNESTLALCLNGNYSYLNSVLYFLRSYSYDTDNFYVFCDGDGYIFYMVTKEYAVLNYGDAYDVTGQVYSGDYNLLILESFNAHSDTPVYEEPVVTEPVITTPVLSKSFNRTYDSYIYDENTGLFFVSNLAANGRPFKLTGVKFSSWENGTLVYLLEFENTSSNTYYMWCNVRLCAENGDSIEKKGAMSSTNLASGTIDTISDSDREAFSGVVIPTSGYVLRKDNWIDDTHGDYSYIHGNSRFVVPSYITYKDNSVLLGYDTNRFNTPIYAVYLDVLTIRIEE